jgi:hypothetical protein
MFEGGLIHSKYIKAMKSPVYRAKTCQPGHPLPLVPGKSAKKVDLICPLGYSFSFREAD